MISRGTREGRWSRRLSSVALALLLGCNSRPEAGSAPNTSAAGAGAVGGGEGQCTTADDCPAPTDDCLVSICREQRCSQDFVAQGTPAHAEVQGDCRAIVCDG